MVHINTIHPSTEENFPEWKPALKVDSNYRVSKKKLMPFKFKFAITYCSNCVKTNGFLLIGQNNLTRCGISIGYGKFEYERHQFFSTHPVQVV